jgi:twitching motility protein PilT
MAIKQTPELEEYLREAAEKDASDVHLIPGEPLTFRVRGMLERTERDPFTPDEIRDIAIAAFGEEPVGKIGSEVGEMRTSCGLPGVREARMCAARSQGQISIVIRLFAPRIFTLEEIKAPEGLVRAATTPCGVPSGLLIFCGPTGSGKTTTAFSVIDHINATRAEHICTVEEVSASPLTPKRSLIQRREIGTDVPDCVSGIRAAMRQDMDVLWVGDLTTLEEVDACLTAAATGHLVLTQLHTTTPEAAIQKIIDIQPEDLKAACRRTLSDVLVAVSAQRLLRRADGKGRVAAYAVLILDDEMRAAIREGRDIFCRRNPLPEGCQTFAEHGKRLIEDGIVTQDEAHFVLGI